MGDMELGREGHGAAWGWTQNWAGGDTELCRGHKAVQEGDTELCRQGGTRSCVGRDMEQTG